MVLDGFVRRTPLDHRWQVLLPVKALDQAKRRLGAQSDPPHLDLVLGMLWDTIEALHGAAAVGDIYVVSPDSSLQAMQSNHGFTWIPEKGDAGLNAAIAQGAAWIHEHSVGSYGLLICTADLPCLTAADIDQILLAARSNAISMVSDAAGTGTTMVLATDGTRLPTEYPTHFGPRSCAAHVQQGAVNLSATYGRALVRAERDVDTPVDLWDARRLGVGVWTSRALTAPVSD
jgi:2-phospho-L-lactate/phosphoenolpyruvate guanylyltransferase